MEPSKTRPPILAVLYLLGMLGLIYLLQTTLSQPATKQVPYSEFLQELRAGHLAEVKISEQTLEGKLKEGTANTGKSSDPSSKAITSGGTIKTTRPPGIDDSGLLEELEDRGVQFSGEATGTYWWLGILVSWVFPLLILFAIYRYGIRQIGRGTGGPLTFGKNRAKIHDQSGEIKVTFNDVAGVDEAKAELVEVVDFLQHPGRYQKLGGHIPKGVLLVGSPGTGKTLLARAVAGEAGVPFFSISGSEFVEMFVGVGAARVRDLFEQAKQRAPCIIFIDELDAIGKTRSSGRMVMSNEEREQTLNQLLVEMDGFDASKGIIIMAATNTPEVLDQALLRAGRFDRQVVLDRPDLAGREAILEVHSRNVKLGPDVDLKTIAARTPGMVGADLANMINEAALLAARRGAEQIEMKDVEEAIDRVLLGLEKKSRVMSEEEKERVAYHETGHALVALSVKHADPVHRVSIVPRSIGALGHTLQLPTHEKYLMTQPELEDRLAVLLGGRAAEEIIYQGVISTGAADDLEKASELVRQMVTRFGMSERLGQLTYGKSQSGRFLSLPGLPEERNYSERTAQEIDDEVRRLVAEIYDRVKKILATRRADLEMVAEELIQRESLDHDELQSLLAHPASARPSRRKHPPRARAKHTAKSP